MPEGMPTHIGTPGTMPPQPGQPQPGQPQPGQPQPGQPPGPATNNPAMNLAQRGAAAQGAQPKQLVGGGMAPTTSVVGNQPGRAALPISPGIG